MMNQLKFAAFGAAAAASLAACTDQSVLDGLRGGGSSGGSAGGAGSDGSIEQQTDLDYDPATPDYFNQVLGDKIFFAVDESAVGPEASAVLDGQARWLLDNPGYNALIEGHADERGTREYNLALGARRASAARDYLVSLGVPDHRLQTVTFGKERPAAVCSAESCWSQNRRAVTVISALPGS